MRKVVVWENGRHYAMISGSEIRTCCQDVSDVGIYKLSKDICADLQLVYTQLGNTNRESNLIEQEYYIYPDMRQKHAVDALRGDVQQTATYLASKLALG